MAVSGRELAEVAARLDEGWLKRTTQLELWELLGYGTLADLADAWLAHEVRPQGFEEHLHSGHVPEEVVERVKRRVRARDRLRLDHNDCARAAPKRLGVERSRCACLTLTLAGLPDAELVKRARVLKAARKIHRRPPKPTPSFAEAPAPKYVSKRVPGLAPVPAQPAPPATLVTETNTMPGRVLPRFGKRTRRWYDNEPSIRDRIF